MSVGTRIRRHLRQNVVGYISLFVALSGTAYAANTVGSGDVIDNSLQSVDLKDNAAVATSDVINDSVTGGGLGSADLRSSAVTSADVRDDTLAGGGLQSVDIAPDALTGSDIDEDTLAPVPIADLAQLANTAHRANELRFSSLYIRTASVVVPGGTQDDSNGNGISSAVQAMCDTFGPRQAMAVGGGAYWSGNPNSNSSELENRIHSATYLDINGDPATAGDLPFGYRVRGEVDKDGDDTLTVQVLCYPAN